MNKLLILGPGLEAKSASTDFLIEEAKKNFDTTYSRLLDAKLEADRNKIGLYLGKTDIKKFDYVLPRIDSRRAEYGYYVVRMLDALNIPRPYPAETILIAHNKFITLEVLAKAGVAVPKTYMTGSPETAANILDTMKFPLMIKILAGYGGKGVMKVDSKDPAMSVVDTMKTLKEEVVIEEFVPNPGEDIRAFVVGDEVIASMKRIAKKGESRANVTSGGRAINYKITKEEIEIALKSARAIDADICAIDMIQSKEGPLVIEVNINPGLQGIMKATNVNIPKYIMDHIKDVIKK